MLYTLKMRKAIKFAIETHEVHQKQKRKGKDIAYIAHPLTVGIILARAGAEEDVVIAGVLHDTIEDSVSEKRVTSALIEAEFGEAVKDLVVSVTEEKQDQQHRNISWRERKIAALEHIPHFSQGSVLVKSADLLSNGTELADDYEAEGPQVFDRFNASAGETLVHYERVIEALLKRWPESPLVGDLKKLSKEIDRMKEGIM